MNEQNNIPEATANTEWHQASPETTFTPKTATRRVGTITLGLVLIVLGALLLWALFDPNFSVLTIAKFSPAILILIGIEMIVGFLRSGQNKLKYDFLSMFLCFLLIVGSLTASAIPAVFQFVVSHEQVVSRLSDQLEDDIYLATRDLKIIDDIDVYLYDYSGAADLPDEELRTASYDELLQSGIYKAHLSVELLHPYDTKEAFATDVKVLLDAIYPLNIPFRSIFFQSDDDAETFFSIQVDRYQLDLTAEELIPLIEAEAYADE